MWRNPPEILSCKMIRLIVFLCMTILPFTKCSKIHELMTKEEVMSVFHEGHASVPAYEVVPVLHSVHRRSPEAKQELHLKAFGKDYNLFLKPNDGPLAGKQVSMWSVERNVSQPDGLRYERISDEDSDIGDIYHDTGNMASILLHRDDNGKVLVEGNIGSNLVIKPLPARVIKEVVSKKQDLHEPHLLPNITRTKRSLEHTHHHVVYKKSARPADDEFSDYAFMEPDHLSKRFRSKRSTSSSSISSSIISISKSRSKREAPYVIYPEILCIVDYDGYRLHGGDNVQIKRYFVSFWNGVDLRYKLLKGPKIRISIAGIIISRGRDATPYLERNRVGRDAIDSAAALTDMGKYLFRERRLPVYDIAVAVTKLDMCRRQYANDVCNRGTAGFAYVGGACVVNKRLEKVNSVAIIEDTGGFSGIIVAAHEVGHLLGAVHDGSPPPSYLGGPGAEKCRWEDGYIMSDLRHTEKGFKWSHCSVSSFHHFLNGDTATCLYNAPHEDEALPRVLPGKLLSLDAQCRKDRGTSACFKDDRVCAQLFCFDASSGYCVAYRPAAEGSPCGDGQYCLNGKCVAEHENIIPDYTQNVPTYVRRENIYNAATQSRPLYARYNTSTTEYRYQWDDTTRSPYQSPYKYTTSYPSTPQSINSIINNDNNNNNNNNNGLTTPGPSYYTTAPVTQAPLSYARYTPSTVSNFITDDQQYKKYSYNYNNNNYNNDYYNNNNNYNYNNNNPYYTSSTTRRTYSYEYSSTTGAYESPNDLGYSRPPAPAPFVYKSSTPGPSAYWSQTNSAQYAPHSYAHETAEVGECQDVGTDCAELIDRLRTWLCHLQSVRSRCCASLKTIC